jgi:hypothetical protein
MKNTAFAIFLLAMSFAAVSAQTHGQAAAWTAFSSKELGFTVSFPVEPTLDKKHLDEQVGDQYIYSASAPGLNYTVIIMDGPAFSSLLDDANLKTFYDAAQKSALDGVNGSHLVTQADLKTGGVRSREMVFDNETRYGRVRFVLSHGRSYSLMAIAARSAEPDAATNAAMAKFLDSFRFN